MIAENLEKIKARCIFVKDWECPIETSEIPLEVCKVCLDARKLQSKQTKTIRQKLQTDGVEILPGNAL
jgi:hypothetical protein